MVQEGRILSGFSIKDEEIVRFVDRLRDEDVNKAKAGQIVLDYQGHTTTRSKEDNADYKQVLRSFFIFL